jgi:hypothetical protein
MTQYPARLLDLDAFKSACPDLRLVENPTPGTPYATLSHCWGATNDTRYRTTTSTFQTRKERIRSFDLPPTYRDAVSVSRHLRIRYLWIDSLCVIQDSLADWKNESARMAEVYSRSCLTIAADWSPNSEGGCYNMPNNRQKIDTQQVIPIQSVLSDGQNSSLYFGEYFSPSLERIGETVLSGRAWALQERLLSPHILHFTQNQLFGSVGELSAAKILYLVYLAPYIQPLFSKYVLGLTSSLDSTCGTVRSLPRTPSQDLPFQRRSSLPYQHWLGYSQRHYSPRISQVYGMKASGTL